MTLRTYLIKNYLMLDMQMTSLEELKESSVMEIDR